MTRAPHRQLAYWTCQLLGWGAYSSLNFVLVRSGWAFSWAVFGLACTHLLRWAARRGGWLRLPASQLILRLLGSSIALSLLTNAASLALLRLAGPAWAGLQPLVLVIFVFNWGVVYLLWQLIYFGVHWFGRWRRSQEAELRALKAQLNPHFLFNALNGIRALISLDPPRAQELVTELAGLLRYVISSSESTLQPLEKELQITRGYLALEAARLEERLQVRVEVADDCLQARVPAMLVQGLVENGIKHGVARLTAGGEIALVARREAGQLTVEVRNPTGPKAGEEPASTGVGLQNARERLRLLFGELASLELSQDVPPGVFVARLRIPLERGG